MFSKNKIRFSHALTWPMSQSRQINLVVFFNNSIKLSRLGIIQHNNKRWASQQGLVWVLTGRWYAPSMVRSKNLKSQSAPQKRNHLMAFSCSITFKLQEIIKLKKNLTTHSTMSTEFVSDASLGEMAHFKSNNWTMAHMFHTKWHH